MYHGIVLDEEFKNPNYPESLTVFAKRKSLNNSWILYGIEVSDDQLDTAIADIQQNMTDVGAYYAHLYNDDILIVIFKATIFKVQPHQSTWGEIKEYGRSLGIPEEQLDFWPNRFQDEPHYFSSKDYLK